MPDAKTIHAFEAELAQKLNAHPELFPSGLEIESIEVLGGLDRRQARKKKGNAAIENLGAGDSIFLTLRPRATTPEGDHPPAATLPAGAGTPVESLVRALADAERVPEHAFVALKWFRDTFLPRQNQAWAHDPAQRHRHLREAIARQWIRLDKIANPKNPNYPTTVLRVNHGNPEVAKIFGRPAALGWGFSPIQLPGRPISESMLEDRG